MPGSRYQLPLSPNTKIYPKENSFGKKGVIKKSQRNKPSLGWLFNIMCHFQINRQLTTACPKVITVIRFHKLVTPGLQALVFPTELQPN